MVLRYRGSMKAGQFRRKEKPRRAAVVLQIPASGNRCGRPPFEFLMRPRRTGASMDKVKYRLNDPRLAPRRTRLEIPGWAGKREPRADGSREQVWHCVPFSEGAQYGIELFYPYDNELRVSTTDGRLVLEGDWGPPPDSGIQWPPFRIFGEGFYTYQILLDLKVEKGMAIRTE